VRAYTDDLLVTCDDHNTIASLIKELDTLDSSFNLRLYKNKSVVVSNGAIEGIPVSIVTSYLGVKQFFEPE
jgi:hypothetical protein